MREALTELRLHPGRFVAVLAAIAISLGFLTVSQVFVQTESDAIAIQQVRYSHKADLIIADKSRDNGAPKLKPAELTATVKAIPGVTDVDYVYQTDSIMRTEQGRNFYSSLFTVPTDPFLWYTVEGRQPANASEIVLNKALSKDIALGQKVRLGFDEDAPQQTVVGFAQEPAGLDGSGAIYVHREYITAKADYPPTALIVKGSATPTQIEDALKDVWPRANVMSSADARKQAMENLLRDARTMQYIIGAFAVIAVLVGIIVIANTFQILVAQRRRQVGLLRAIGGSSGQVRRRFLAEAVLLGLVGSLLGVLGGVAVSTALSTFWTESIAYGLSIPWLKVAGIILFGVVVTVIGSLAPIRTALKVAPLEALHPAQTADQRRKGGWIRGIICTLLVLAGAFCAYTSATTSAVDNGQPLMWALAAGCLISLGVLFAAQLYVPLMLRGLGRILGFTPTGRLATYNAARNPKRAASTAVALMLSIGLIVTIQVGGATIKRTVSSELDRTFPTDLAVGADNFAAQGIPAEKLSELRRLDNVEKVWTFTLGADAYAPLPILKYDASLKDAFPHPIPDIKPGEAFVPKRTIGKNYHEGETFALRSYPGGDRKQEPKTVAVTVRGVEGIDVMIVDPGKFSEAFGGGVADGYAIVKVKDRAKAADTAVAVQEKIIGSSSLLLGGSALHHAQFDKILDTMMLIVTGLLAAAAIIALIGVANTLGLSVVERRRENAMLRALGLQSGGVRKLLLVEAIVLSGVGAVVGIMAGIGFGFLGGNAVMRITKIQDVVFSVDPVQTLIVIAVALVSAMLASWLPGRTAAKATPIEALADLG